MAETLRTIYDQEAEDEAWDAFVADGKRLKERGETDFEVRERLFREGFRLALASERSGGWTDPCPGCTMMTCAACGRPK